MPLSGRGGVLYSRVLVTGANGLVGQALCRELGRNLQHDVLATGRQDILYAPNASVGYTPMDLEDHASVRALVRDYGPTVVVNCAAMTQVDRCETDRERCWRVNVDAVSVLAETCRAVGARLIQVSTDFVFSGLDGPYAERARPDPVNFYGKSKLAAENAAREAGADRWAVARTVLVFGTGVRLTRPNIALWVAGSLRAGKDIRVVRDQFRSPTYAPDLARGLEAMVDLGATGTFHLSGRETLSVHAFALRAAQAFELDETRIHPTDGDHFSQTAPRPLDTRFDITKASRVLGYQPRTIESAFRDMRPGLDGALNDLFGPAGD